MTYHKNARTTVYQRKRMRQSHAPYRMPAKALGVSVATVAKWTRRPDAADRSSRPQQQYTALPPEAGPLLGWLRKDWLLDLDTVWLALRQAVFPQLSRSAVYRELVRFSLHQLHRLRPQPSHPRGRFPRVSPRIPAYRHRCLATPRWRPTISVRRHRSGDSPDDHAGRHGPEHGQCSRISGALSTLLSVPPVSGVDRQRAGVHAARLSWAQRRSHDHGPSVSPAMPTQPHPAQSDQGLPPLDQWLGRTHRRHHQSRDRLSLAFQLHGNARRGALWVRTVLQRASTVQSHRGQDPRAIDAGLVSPCTQTISPTTVRSAHNVVTLDKKAIKHDIVGYGRSQILFEHRRTATLNLRNKHSTSFPP